MSKTDIVRLSREYRDVRKAVFQEATRPLDDSPSGHTANKSLVRSNIERICAEADLRRYLGSDLATARRIWHQFWTKIRYAGFNAKMAGDEIKDIEHIFDDFREFSTASWNIEAKGDQLLFAGKEVHHFCRRTGRFKKCRTIAKVAKLCKIVQLARALANYAARKPADESMLNFVTNGHRADNIWQIHDHLLKIGYADLTALHLMMDLGFSVIKPDIIISRQFLTRGWLRLAAPNLPRDLTLKDLEGKGRYGGRYRYINEVVYKPIINLAREIVKHTSRSDLIADIGWATKNPLREFDIFLVKYGQQPDPNFGIERCLAAFTAPSTCVATVCPTNR